MSSDALLLHCCVRVLTIRAQGGWIAWATAGSPDQQCCRFRNPAQVTPKIIIFIIEKNTCWVKVLGIFVG